MAELAFRSWEGRNANVLNRPLIHIGCFLFTILTIESPRAFLSQRYGFESIDFILFFLRWGGRVRFDGGILSTVKEYILDKNGEKVKLKNGNYKTRKIDTVDWNEQGKAEEWRKSWADITNKAYTKLKKNKQDTFYNEHTAEIVLFEIAKNI